MKLRNIQLCDFERHNVKFFLVTLIVLILDQFSKHYVLGALQYGVPVSFMPGFNWTLVFNEGAAFSFLSEAGGWQRWFFTITGILISCFLVGWLLRLRENERLTAYGLALILGGAIGNIIDRVRLGYVVDFIDWYWRSWHWPAFNIADSAITVGVACLLLVMWIDHKNNRSEDV